MALQNKKSVNLITEAEPSVLKEKQKKLEKLEKALKKKEQDQVRKKGQRQQEKDALQEVLLENPELKKKLKKREVTGRPRLEEDQPELLKAITDIAMYGSAADERRRSESIRSVRTLDQLTEELSRRGFLVKFLDQSRENNL